MDSKVGEGIITEVIPLANVQVCTFHWLRLVCPTVSILMGCGGTKSVSMINMKFIYFMYVCNRFWESMRTMTHVKFTLMEWRMRMMKRNTNTIGP